MSDYKQAEKRQENDTGIAVMRHVTETAREALKQIVSQNMLPWPDIYSAEFWKLARNGGYDEILLRQHGITDKATDMATEFLDRTDEILDGVQNTVHNFVAEAKIRREHMATTIENIKNIPIDDPDISQHLDQLFTSNTKLQNHSSELESQLSQQTRIINELQNQLRIDPMTGLLNRGALNKDMQKEIARALRYKYPVSIFMADIDHFKDVNDRYGHMAGDAIIKITAHLIKNGVRKADSVYRYGGEEFLALLPHTDSSNAMIFAERIREKIARYLFVDRKHDISIKVTISAGITELGRQDDAASFIARSDKALYLAKQSGRNRVEKIDL